MMKELLRTFKKPLLVLGVIIVVFFVLNTIIPTVRNINAEKSPIVKIQAENNREYRQGDTISARDFEVEAVHENGQTTPIDSDDIEISRKKPNKTGKTTTVEIVLKSDKSLTTTVKIKNQREKIVSFECGFPDVKDVKAILYSNGELCFEGEGDVLQYKDGSYPWKNYEGKNENPIISISFHEGVKPKYLDNYFSEIATLEYVENIPSSVVSLNKTFKNCTALTDVPDISNCSKLLDMTGTFMGCKELKNVSEIPKSVRNIDSMCQGCTLLQVVPDLSKAVGVITSKNAFADCSTLTNAEIAPKTENMEGMFQNCINLKKMPEIPETVLNINSAFDNNTSLSKLTFIPASVSLMENTFYNCSKLEGELIIDANPIKYNGVFNGAAIATKLNITGSSNVLNALALTAGETNNITVNGNKPTNQENTATDTVE